MKKTFLQIFLIFIISCSANSQSLSNQFDAQQSSKRNTEDATSNRNNNLKKSQSELDSRGTIIECIETTSSGNRIINRWGFIDSYVFFANISRGLDFTDIEPYMAKKTTKVNDSLSWNDDATRYEYSIKKTTLYSQSIRGGEARANPCTILKGNKF